MKPPTHEFWKFFDAHGENLFQREPSFGSIFEHLDQISHPIVIVETGCVRGTDLRSMTGEGQSTIFFDKYLLERRDPEFDSLMG